MSYQIFFSLQADNDMVELEAYIRDELDSPHTASNYMKGLDDTIQKLSLYADCIGATNKYVQKMFGFNARHIVFKKMTIIFFVEDDIVYVKRVIASSLIH